MSQSKPLGINERLVIAVKRNRFDEVKRLLSNAANPKTKDNYPLRHAAQQGYADIVDLLLEFGADVHSNNDYALRWAAEKGHTRIVASLLAAGANAYADDDYAITAAKHFGHTAACLVLANARPNDAYHQSLYHQILDETRDALARDGAKAMAVEGKGKDYFLHLVENGKLPDLFNAEKWQSHDAAVKIYGDLRTALPDHRTAFDHVDMTAFHTQQSQHSFAKALLPKQGTGTRNR